ncbi:MAG: adenine phosphoribosyltransferase [Thermomicrobiales bacterium]
MTLPSSNTSTDTTTTFGERLKQSIRDIPDFPEPGIMFRDISTLLASPELFRQTVDAMAAPFSEIDKVVVIESRGFILGTPIAYAIGAGVVPVRKPGRLPAETLSESYTLEYGSNSLEIHRDAIAPGERILIVDDLLATGGTVNATVKLVERLQGEIIGVSVLAELSALHGRDTLPPGVAVHSLVVY